MSISEHVSTIRNLVKQYNQSLAPYSDSFLYSNFASAASLLQTRTYEKGSRQSWWNTKSFCIKMIEDVSHPCPECINVGCKVLKSVVKIPKPLQLKNRDLIRVSTLDGRELHLIQPYERDAKLTDEFFQNVKMATFINDHLIVYAKQKPTTVIVTGHFQDITDWSNINECGTDGEETGNMCYNPLQDDFPLDADLVYPAYQAVLDFLQIPIKLPQDNSNNINNQQ